MIENVEQQIKELTEARDLFEHKMHMTDWNILMLKRWAVIEEHNEDYMNGKSNSD